jgi:ubiquinol-cytochrome c reductase cytochrome c subunit
MPRLVSAGAGKRIARRFAVGLAVLAVFAVAASAIAEPPSGIVHVRHERSMSPRELGSQLYAGNCATCHGIAGQGTPIAPPLRGAGARAADFYLSTGYMPLGSAHEQPMRVRVLLNKRERDALVAYVASLGKGPPIPTPDPASGDVAEGRELFTEHCAGCHQVVAEGGIMPGAKAPPLSRATPVQIAEAVRIGPYVMPTFTEKDITDDELNSIIAYVQYAQDPYDAGGWGIDHLGPFPEGMVAWLIAIVVLVGTCMIIGKRLKQT